MLLRVFGDHANISLIANVVFGVALVVCVDWAAQILAGKAATVPRRALLTAAVVTFTPLTTLAATGMEHVLHAAAMLLFVVFAARFVAEQCGAKWTLMGLAALATGTRYESLFAVATVAMILFLQKRIRSAIELGLAGALPVVAYGAYSRAHGGYWLPTSVLLKRRVLELGSLDQVLDVLGGDLFWRLATEQHLLALALGAAGAACWLIGTHRSRSVLASAVFIGSVALIAHVQFAGLGWFYRYDSYLVAMMTAVVGSVVVAATPPLTAERLKRFGVLAFGAFGAAAFFATIRSGGAPRRRREDSPRGSQHLQQQVQSAFPGEVFRRTSSPSMTSARWHTTGTGVIDLVGLADKRVADAKAAARAAHVLRRLPAATEPASVAIVYDEWFTNLSRTGSRSRSGPSRAPPSEPYRRHLRPAPIHPAGRAPRGNTD